MRSTDRIVSRATFFGAMIVLATVVLLSVAGCWGSEEATTGVPEVATTETVMSESPAQSTTTLEAVSTTTGAPVDTTPSVEVDGTEGIEDLGSGRATACGIIKEVWMDGSTRRLKIDYVDFLTGDNAVLSAVADGVISPGEFIEYYARNLSPELRAFSVSDSVVITTFSRESPMDVADSPMSWEDFYGLWNSVGPVESSDFGLSDGLWWIERDGTGILSIEQQWVP